LISLMNDDVCPDGLIEFICSKAAKIWDQDAHDPKRKDKRLLRAVVAVYMFATEPELERLSGPTMTHFYNRLASQMGVKGIKGAGGTTQEMKVIIRKVADILTGHGLAGTPKQELLQGLLPPAWLEGVDKAERAPSPTSSEDTIAVEEPTDLKHETKRKAEHLMAQLRELGYDLQQVKRPRPAAPTASEGASAYRSLGAPVFRSLDGDPDDVQSGGAAYRSLGAFDSDGEDESRSQMLQASGDGVEALVAQLRALGFKVDVSIDDNDDPISASALAAAASVERGMYRSLDAGI